MKKIQIDHIGIAVKEIESAMNIFTKYFAGTIGEREVYANFGLVSQMLNFNNAGLEIMEPMDENGLIGKFIKNYGEGLHHISIRVENIVEEIACLSKDGYKPIGEPIHIHRGNSPEKVVFLNPKQFNGILIELIEVEQKPCPSGMVKD
ncbi:VOC family protein [Anaerovirgula multivorans]|nr:VOC family protein [Anaerovirgula multivorans]